MAEPPPEDFPTAARVVGVIYLTLCSALGGGVFLFRHPDSIYCRLALAVAVVAGLVLALLAPIKDPTVRPIRWGLLWLAVGFVVGPCLVFGVTYLVFKAAG
jgi:hypothetical protein